MKGCIIMSSDSSSYILESYKNNLSEKNRQHINLTNHAWSIIKKDQLEFDNTEPLYLSSFLNKIFLMYYNLSLFPINIEDMIIDKKNEFNKTIGKYSLDLNLQTSLLNDLINTYKDELKVLLTNKEKGSGEKIRLNKDVYDLSRIQPNSIKSEFFSSTGKYLNAVFENYASKSYMERERIFFNDKIALFQEAIRLKRSINITLRNGSTYHVIPYSIRTDRLSSYNYIIGISTKIDKAENVESPKLASFRLSRIESIRINSDNYVLSNDDKKSIENEIQNKGVAFLLSEKLCVKIKLTSEGQKSYFTRFHMRPPLIKQTDDIFEFHATATQILYYFFSFRNDAEILEPLELRDYFKNEYYKAYENYCK